MLFLSFSYIFLQALDMSSVEPAAQFVDSFGVTGALVYAIIYLERARKQDRADAAKREEALEIRHREVEAALRADFKENINFYRNKIQ